MTSWPPDGTSDSPADVTSPDVAYRSRRRVWRRRRRVLGTLAFVAAVGVLFYVVARATGVGDDDEAERVTTSSTASTTTTLPPAGPYRVLDGLNTRAGPGPTFPIVGTIEIGHTVMVLCVADGTIVNGPNGESTQWLKVQTASGDAYVTAAYVSIGADLTDPATIAPCVP